MSSAANFTQHTAKGFGWPDQVALADTIRLRAQCGCSVMASSASIPEIHALYRKFWIQPVRRAINSDASKRTGVIVTTYPAIDAQHPSL